MFLTTLDGGTLINLSHVYQISVETRSPENHEVVAYVRGAERELVYRLGEGSDKEALMEKMYEILESLRV